jgi:uncharacterized protein (DUF433 family)
MAWFKIPIGTNLCSSLAEEPQKCHIDGMKKSVVEVDPEKMGGTPVFCGTRVPIDTFIDYIEGGETVDAFLEDFPTVKREQVIEYLDTAKEKMFAEAV